MRVAETGVQRLRNLAKSTLLQVAEPKLKPKAIKLLDHAGFIGHIEQAWPLES